MRSFHVSRNESFRSDVLLQANTDINIEAARRWELDCEWCDCNNDDNDSYPTHTHTHVGVSSAVANHHILRTST